MTFTKKKLALAVAVSLSAPISAYATNGMNLEGYGAIATGMGGASMAYDNGTAAVMNNPATLGLMEQGNRVDVALGFLGPDITSKMAGMPDAESSADAFYMPAIGWARKAGQLTYGAGVFGQGGMGTEYAANSFLAAGSNEMVRSEVSMGRFIIPLAYEVNKNVNIAGSLDYVWAGMDLKMALSGAQFLDMAGGFGGSMSSGTVSGSMMTAFGNFVAGGVMNPANPVNWGRFDFSNSSDFTGEATGTGFAGKIGATFKVNDQLTLGTSYHSKTDISDLESDNATVSFNANVDTGIAAGGAPSGTYVPATIPLTGKISVRDFQWPQMFGFGAAFQANDKLMLVADYKWINWKDSMKDFKMTFTADSTQSGLAQGFAGTVLDATMFQNWDDQNVIMLGGSYKFTEVFTLRAGANFASNPIPDQYVNPLFPATIENHYMLGAGFNVGQASAINASITYAPEVEVTNPGSPAAGDEVTISHSQLNWQLMYSTRF